MSLLTEISRILPEPPRSQADRCGIQLVYVLESYAHALKAARAARLEVLLEAEKRQPDSTVSFNHYWPPLQHNQLSRSSPPLFHKEEGLGGVSEPEFRQKGVCLVVDNSVESGSTLLMTNLYLGSKGYRPEQVFVASEVWRNGCVYLPFAVRPLGFFASHLSMAENMLTRDLTPFLSPSVNGNGTRHAGKALSLPQTIAAYCRLF